MKPDLFKSALCLLALGVLLPSCIEQDYSIKDIDTTMTVLPGLTVQLNSSVEIGILDLLSLSEQDFVKVDKDGNYEFRTDTYSNTFYLDDFDLISGFKWDIYREFILWDYYIKPELRKGTYSMHCPIRISVVNPTCLTLTMSALIHTQDYSRSIQISDIVVKPGSNSIDLKRDDIMDLFNPFESTVVVSDISLSYRRQGTTAVDLNLDQEYCFDFSVSLPLMFMPGDGFEYEFYSDVFNDSEFLDNLYGMGFRVEKMNVDASVENRIPFDINLSAEDNEDSWAAKITFDRDIEAGNQNVPVKTDMGISFLLPDGADSLNEPKLHIKARVPEKYSDGIMLNENQKLILNMGTVEFKDGVILNF